MCGIAGIVGPFETPIVERMTAALRHRGPDGTGHWVSKASEVQFGHTRLSIIDTTNAGAQPMASFDGRLHIVFNGEIYNYRELRRELEAHYPFASHSDTEVLLAAYHRWGPECVKRLRGMFAFAIHDKTPHERAPIVLLARDPLGIKPLLYSQTSKGLAFASELCALLELPEARREIDSSALFHYLRFGYVLQPRTMVRGIRSLPPGTMLEFHRSGEGSWKWKESAYFDLHDDTARLRSELRGIKESEARQRVREALFDAANHHMIADVEVGALLSGGIDSAAVVALMRKVSGKRIHTFSIGFEGQFSSYNELEPARETARFLGTDHQEQVVGSAEIANVFETVVGQIDQPSIDGTNTWLASRLASSKVKVVLSGLGGDELFAGYSHFRWLARPSLPMPPALSHVAQNILGRIQKRRPNRFTFHAMLGLSSERERLALLRRQLLDWELQESIQPEFQSRKLGEEDGIEGCFKPDMDQVQKTSFAEVKGYLLSTLLRDSDTMSMAHGVELRPILLDLPLVRLVYSLPAALKLTTPPKKLLLDSVNELLPGFLRHRPKRGFELPFSGWMAGPLKEQVLSLLESRNGKSLFQQKYLAKLLQATRGGKPPRELWAWVVLLQWLQKKELSPLPC